MKEILESTTKKDFLDRIVDRLKSQSLNLFVGAGISKNSPSNLPLANEFRIHAFKALSCEEKLQEVYERNSEKLGNIPFESFVKLMISGSNFFDYFVKIFSAGKPNRTHILISELLSKGFVSNILTTNFDTLLEQAVVLHQKNLSDLNILFNEEQFKKTDFNFSNHPTICKIHGSIQNPSSIRATIDLISRQDLLQARISVLDYFFNNSKKDLLIMGYSCSDEFDVNPFVNNLKSKTKVLIIKHNPNVFRIERHSEPFSSFSGNQILCDTDDVVNHLWKKFVRTDYEEHKTTKQNWKNIIEEWNFALFSAQRLFLIGNVLLEMREADSAIFAFNEAKKRPIDKELKVNLVNRLATAHLLKGNYVEAAKLYRQNLLLLKEGTDDIKIAEVYHFLGWIQKLMCDYDDAEQLLKKSLNLSHKIGFSFGIARVLAELGTLHQRRGDFKEAKTLYEQALVINRKNGYLSGIAVCLSQLGMITRIEGNIKKAKILHLESLDIRKKLGDKHGIAASKHEIALCEMRQGKLDLAEKLFRETLQLLEEIGDKARIAWTLHDLGTVFYLRKDYKQSEALNQKSIEIARSKNDQRGISLGLGMIGVIRMKQGKYAEAESLLLESYEICQKLKDKHGMETVLKNLMIVYSSTHNFKKLYRTMALLKSL